MEMKIKATRADKVYADLRDHTTLKMHEMKLQIEKADGCGGG